MKKFLGIISIILLVIGGINIIGFVFLVFSNQEKLNNGSGYFLNKLFLSLFFIIVGIYLTKFLKKEEKV